MASNATQPSTTKDIHTDLSPNEPSLVTKSTLATLHIFRHNSESNTRVGMGVSLTPSSARVHIQTPNPSVKVVESSLTTPNHVCCVVDVSGSMALPAKSKDEHGNVAEDAGLTILDIVKFSTLVIAESLNPQDKLSIVTYSDNARVALPPTNMTLDGKEKVKSMLATINTECRTNLFAGLKLGIEQAHEVGNECVNSVYVLTDGYPNIHPNLGYELSIAQVLSDTPIFGAISTFGFGYNLDSKLLTDVSKIGGGYYSFIPDAGMVGTCFINALANSRCAFGVNVTLKISGFNLTRLAESNVIPSSVAKRNGAKKSPNVKGIAESIPNLTIDGRLETSLLDNDIFIKLTPLRYGSDVDVMLNPILFMMNEDIKLTLSFETVGGETQELKVSSADGEAANELYHSKRVQFVNDASNISFNPFTNSACNTFLNAAKESTAGSSNLDALYQDMKVEATAAIADEASFKSWGKHFLLSLSTAHLHQYCNNFKDPGVQVYGTGVLFSSLQDSLDDTFEQVPPPVPSGNNRAHVSTRPIQMSNVFNNRNAACVHGKTIVAVKILLAQKTDSYSGSSSTISYIPMCNIHKGDLVLTADGTYSKVDCLVETVLDEETQQPFELIKVGQLCVTPYHPVKQNQHSGWQFPIQISGSKQMEPGDDQYAAAYSVYNLVLEKGHRHKAVIMDGVESITLGHGITNNTTLRHSYFGTDKVVSDLEILGDGNGWKAGHVVLRENNVKRDPSSGHICHISDMKAADENDVTTTNVKYPCVPCAV